MNEDSTNLFIQNLGATPLAVAHRGASGLAPENTIASFRLAFELGCACVELDVRPCRDGTIVVVHDASVDRTTNHSGQVAELSWEELSLLDAGSWFRAPAKPGTTLSLPALSVHPVYPERSRRAVEGSRGHSSFTGERVPRLEDVLDFAKTLPAGSQAGLPARLQSRKLSLVIEIKSPGIEKQVVQLVRGFRMHERCVIVSFHPEALEAVATLPAPLPTGWIVWAPRPGAIPDEELVRGALQAKAQALVVSHTALSAGLVARAHEKGLAVLAWTVDTASRMRAVLKMGPDGVATNRPDILLPLVRG
jgi:glycerophosphoryl diester phosphodiesterase